MQVLDNSLVLHNDELEKELNRELDIDDYRNEPVLKAIVLFLTLVMVLCALQRMLCPHATLPSGDWLRGEWMRADWLLRCRQLLSTLSSGRWASGHVHRPLRTDEEHAALQPSTPSPRKRGERGDEEQAPADMMSRHDEQTHAREKHNGCTHQTHATDTRNGHTQMTHSPNTLMFFSQAWLKAWVERQSKYKNGGPLPSLGSAPSLSSALHGGYRGLGGYQRVG